jgi:MFS family permease
MKAKNRGFYLLMLTSITLSMGVNAVTPLQPLFIVDVGASNLELGLIMSISSLIGLISRIPLGILSDRVGRRIMMLLASLVQFASLLSFAFVTDVAQFYPLMALQALIWGFFGPSAIALASDMASADRIGRVMGLYYTSVGFGMFIGPLVSSVLAEYLVYRQMFLVLTVLPMTGLLSTLRQRPLFRGFRVFDESDAPPVATSLRRVLSSRNVIGLCLSRVTFSLAAAIVGTLLAVWAKTELLFTASMISILFSARGAANFLVRTPTGSIVDRFGKRGPTIFAFALTALVFLLFSQTTHYLALILIMVLYGVAWGIRVVADTAILMTSVESRDKDIALALLMAMFALGNSVGALLAGVAYTVLPMAQIFQLSAGLLVVGVVVLASVVQ